MSMTEFYGEVISGYSREQAIDDGVLVDLTDAIDDGGKKISPFKFPVAMTRAAYEATISAGGEWIENDDGTADLKLPGCQDVTGRLWDVFWMLQCATRRAAAGQQFVNFQVAVLVDGVRKKRVVKLKCLCGPGDNAEPVLTIMLPGED